MKTEEILQKGSMFLRDCFRDAMDLHYEEEIALTVARQKEEDICCTIAAFFEIKTPENEIMRLLSKFYGVDSITEATELITTVKVENQVNALREHHVRTQLQTDYKLQNMAIYKLKVYFDKH